MVELTILRVAGKICFVRQQIYVARYKFAAHAQDTHAHTERHTHTHLGSRLVYGQKRQQIMKMFSISIGNFRNFLLLPTDWPSSPAGGSHKLLKSTAQICRTTAQPLQVLCCTAGHSGARWHFGCLAKQTANSKQQIVPNCLIVVSALV